MTGPTAAGRAVSAPGKLMISGEYVVLDGEAAVVAAVDRRLVARWSPPRDDGSAGAVGRSPEHPGLGPEARLTLEHAEARFGAVPMSLALDAAPLRQGARKLGLGSSSAGSVAAAGAVAAFHGEDVASLRPEILRLAIEGHRAVAPQGSGADVAAAALGGVLSFVRDEPDAARPIRWPEGLEVRVVWTGVPARTSELVGPVRRLAAESADAYRSASAPLRDAARSLRGALLDGRAGDAVRAAAAHGAAMGELGDRAGAPILTAGLARVAALAREHAGGAKPSGAGGGDVALAFFTDPERAEAFAEACRADGLDLVSCQLGDEGVRIDR
ncbi:MAG: mevalonate kinase [Sandaracinaceae bacterium]